MAPKSYYCGFNITTCAIFVAISGICSTISAVTIAIFSEQFFDSYPIWFYIGIGIITVIIYFLVFIGIAKQSYGYLIPAEILLGIKIILAFIFIIWFILCGLYLPETIFKEFKIISLFNDVRIAIRNVFFTISAMSFLYLNFVVYSFFVIQSTRQWLASDSKNINTFGAENAEVLFNKRRRSLSPIFPETGKYMENDSGILVNSYDESPRFSHLKKFNEENAKFQQTRIFIPSRYHEFRQTKSISNLNPSTKIEYLQDDKTGPSYLQPLIYSQKHCSNNRKITDV